MVRSFSWPGLIDCKLIILIVNYGKFAAEYRMLKYYTSNNHEGMPLGCMVGPLSETMKIRVFSQQADHLKKVGLYKTERPTPPKTSKKTKNSEKIEI